MDLPKRKQNRVEKYDYSQNGAYYITVCTSNRRLVLSSICRGNYEGCPNVELTQLGIFAVNTIEVIERLFGIKIDKYVIMPDHIHFIIIISKERATARVAPTGKRVYKLQSDQAAAPTVGQIIGAFKSIVYTEWLKRCKQENQGAGKLWQRNFYEHIIRNEQDYQEVYQYIDDNPIRWIERIKECYR